MRPKRSTWAILGASSLLASACIGSIGDGDGEGENATAQSTIVRAPLRRLTRFEYNNTVRDLFGDTTEPANALPADASGNGFGNDADALSVSSLLIEQYADVAEDVAERAVTSGDVLPTYSPCVSAVSEATASACAREVIAAMVPLAFRRPITDEEVDGLLALFDEIHVEDVTFASAMAGVIEAVLQSPEFLYRPELGEPTANGRRMTGWEMATRLSYLLWSTTPDEVLRDAAAAGELDTAEGVAEHARRMIADERAEPMLAFFFDALLPIGSLASAERSEELYPDYTPEIGELMREETQRFLLHAIFEGEGSWPGMFTADYTFVNGPLAAYYGIDGVEGDAFEQVPLDGEQRLGLLTHGSILTGTTHSNLTSPVKRGAFIANHLLCQKVPFPTGELADEVTPPEPYEGATARERYEQHSSDPVCKGCHQFMDPMGLALENFDAVGRWRDTENDVVIDASGTVPGYDGGIDGPVELAQALASVDELNSCFAQQWMSYAYGRSLDVSHEGDAETRDEVQAAFSAAGYDVVELVVALTQSPSFLTLPKEPE